MHSILDILTWLNAVSSKKISFHQEEMAKYFNDNVIYIKNGSQLCDNLDSLFKRFKQIIESRQCTSITFPLKGYVTADALAAVCYELNITNNDMTISKKEVIAIIKMHDNKIISWNAVIA